MSIIDFHAHIYPSKISERAVQSIGEFYHIPMDGGGTAEILLDETKGLGISNYVVHSVAVTPAHVPVINEFISAECRKHPEFVGFGTIHAGCERPLEEIEQMQKLGLRGIKIHPDTQQFCMDDERMFPVYDAAQEKGLPILIHCGDYRYDYSHPRRLTRILDLFPHLTVIAAHFGGWSVFDLAVEYLKDRQCFLDTSSSIPMIGHQRAAELIYLYGVERIVYGTDFPMWNPRAELESFFEIPLGDDEREKILYGNAAKILNL